MSIVLASTSPIRAAMLTAAGVEFEVVAPGIDEGAVAGAMSGGLALRLAEAKALAGSEHPSDAWTIGSDSTVAIDGRAYDKPRDRQDAVAHLREFSGRMMILTSAVALARDGHADWSITDSAQLHFRDLSNAFIESYLDAEWPDVGYCVGVFRLEGRGVQLFERIEGNHFTILGMPLLPLLGALRDRGAIPR